MQVFFKGVGAVNPDQVVGILVGKDDDTGEWGSTLILGTGDGPVAKVTMVASSQERAEAMAEGMARQLNEAEAEFYGGLDRNETEDWRKN